MDIIEKILNNVEKTAKTVVQKSNDVVEITKLKIAISNAEAEADVLIKEVGQLVYEAYKSGEGNPEVVEKKCAQIEELRKDIEDKRNQFAKLRNLKRCNECEYENEAEAVYCCKCGSKLPDVVTCQVDDMPPGTEQKEDVVIDAENNDGVEKDGTQK